MVLQPAASSPPGGDHGGNGVLLFSGYPNRHGNDASSLIYAAGGSRLGYGSDAKSLPLSWPCFSPSAVGHDGSAPQFFSSCLNTVLSLNPNTTSGFAMGSDVSTWVDNAHARGNLCIHGSASLPISTVSHGTTATISPNSTISTVIVASVLSSGPICPWGFLNPNTKPVVPQQKSFTELFKSPLVDIHKPSIPDPIIRGENIVIRTDDTLYNESLKTFEHALIGKLILFKGIQPYHIDVVRHILQDYYSLP